MTLLFLLAWPLNDFAWGVDCIWRNNFLPCPRWSDSNCLQLRAAPDVCPARCKHSDSAEERAVQMALEPLIANRVCHFVAAVTSLVQSLGKDVQIDKWTSSQVLEVMQSPELRG